MEVSFEFLATLTSVKEIALEHRQKPKKKLIRELKLSTNIVTCHAEEFDIERVADGWVDPSTESTSVHISNEVSPSSQKYKRHKQLLQFDKANRPAFYGFWPKKSQVVKARQPFVKDPELDYEIDSDEEWEEEEPGESLSDCDKDDENENLEEGCSRDEDEEESEDGFFVPDGYLSEDEMWRRRRCGEDGLRSVSRGQKIIHFSRRSPI